MKRTIALVLSLIFMLVLVPTTALADNDVEARLDVTINTGTKTLFRYGTENLNWDDSALTVKLYDNTLTNLAGTTLTLDKAVSAGKYVIYINETTIYDSVAKLYTFQLTDLGKKTLTISYTYTPTGHTNPITVTKDITISVQKNALKSLAATGPTLKEYYAGECLNLAGLAVTATYDNTTGDPTALTSDKYVVTATEAAGANPIAETAPLTAAIKQILVTKTETYEGSDEKVTAEAAIPITVAAAASSMTISPAELNMLITDSPVTVTAVPDVAVGSLVASVDKPAIASINTSTLTTDGKVIVTPLSIGQAIVTIRARGSNISKTVVVNVTKAPTLASSLSLDKSTLILPVNGTYSLAATIGPDDTTDKTIVWSSSSPNDVSVDSTGTVKILRDFTTAVVITAVVNTGDNTTTDLLAANDIKQTCSVTVNTVAVDGISLSDTSITLYKGSWKTISAVVTPSGAADPAVTWTSSAPSVATVDSTTGKITAVGVPTDKEYGEATITAQTSNSSVKATVTVKVLPAVLITSLTLNKSDLALNVGDEETLTVTGTPSTATNKTINWSSSNKDVASVSSSGKIIAAAKGTAVIKAEATDGSGKYASCVVTVNNIQVLNVYLDKSSFDLSEGDTATVKATIYPTNATNQAIKWTSSNTSVATVDSKGNITAGATKGYSIITAAATDGSGKYAECVVLSKPKISVTGITINYGASLDLLVSDSTYLKATILPANATTQTATWTSSNASVASIDANGLLKGLALGEATITATADGKTASIKITVTNTEYNYGVAANFRRRVNVRANASGLSKLVGYAYVGDTFKILGKTGSWYYIQYNNTTKGYIWASYLNATKTSASYTSAGSATSAGTTSSPGTTSTPTKATITNCLYAVNVRASASTTSTRIGKATLGSTYTYLATEGDWIKVQYNTTTIGYIFSTFISLS